MNDTVYPIRPVLQSKFDPKQGSSLRHQQIVENQPRVEESSHYPLMQLYRSLFGAKSKITRFSSNAELIECWHYFCQHPISVRHAMSTWMTEGYATGRCQHNWDSILSGWHTCNSIVLVCTLAFCHQTADCPQPNVNRDTSRQSWSRKARRGIARSSIVTAYSNLRKIFYRKKRVICRSLYWTLVCTPQCKNAQYDEETHERLGSRPCQPGSGRQT